MTEFLLIRHAVNDFVKTNRLAGWTPEVHLNEEGRAQAAALGVRLANKHIDVIYSSPLERTVETAQAVVEHHPELQLQLLEEIGEVKYGDWTGQEIRKLAQRKMWRVIQVFPSRAYFPNGETMRGAQMRAVNALEVLATKHPRETVAVVSHSDLIKMILAHYLGMHLDLFQRIDVSPASLSIIQFSAGRPTIVQINETSYLPKPAKKKAPAFEQAFKDNKPVQSIVIDATGEPGARTFYLQAILQPDEKVSFVLEKTQAILFADEADSILNGQPESAPAERVEVAALQEPEQTLFRIGKLGLQYNNSIDLFDVEVIEMLGKDQGTPEVVHLWITRPQLRVLADHARTIARSGAS
jgi:probable phosphomutase (TIGR03848 family)/uncharacterized repeat protein (TIGR03847 family)